MPLTKGLFVEDLAYGAEVVAQRGDLHRAFRGRLGQRVAHGRARVDEAGPGQVQAHDLHQHLVGVGSAVEGAGAGAVIAFHLGLHQFVAAHFAGGELLAHLRFLVVGQAAGHRARGHEDAGDVAEGCRGHDQPRHDLVAHPHVKRAVEGVVRQPHGGGQRDHVAREQRQFHPCLALGHAVAHGRHAAGHLRGAPRGARGGADLVGEMLEGLMRRQHVVVGGDDAEVGAAFIRERGLVVAHGGIGMGLVAAGQVRPARALGGRGRHALEVVAAGRFAARDDPVGDSLQGLVNAHVGPLDQSPS